MLNILRKIEDHENHVRWIYLATVLNMGESQKHARKHITILMVDWWLGKLLNTYLSISRHWGTGVHSNCGVYWFKKSNFLVSKYDRCVMTFRHQYSNIFSTCLMWYVSTIRTVHRTCLVISLMVSLTCSIVSDTDMPEHSKTNLTRLPVLFVRAGRWFHCLCSSGNTGDSPTYLHCHTNPDVLLKVVRPCLFGDGWDDYSWDPLGSSLWHRDLFQPRIVILYIIQDMVLWDRILIYVESMTAIAISYLLMFFHQAFVYSTICININVIYHVLCSPVYTVQMEK